jgi:hypothetical protein
MRRPQELRGSVHGQTAEMPAMLACVETSISAPKYEKEEVLETREEKSFILSLLCSD